MPLYATLFHPKIEKLRYRTENLHASFSQAYLYHVPKGLKDGGKNCSQKFFFV